MSRDQALTVIRQFQSETDAIREAPEPLPARAAVFLLAGVLVAAIIIAYFMPIDRVIASDGGRIVSSEMPNVFQALDPSIIKTIDVKEGDVVKSGQLLATLDPTFAAADVDQLRQQVAALKAEIIRATAEEHRQQLVFDVAADPDLAPYAAMQRTLYDQRAAALGAQLKSFDEQIKQAQATIAKLTQDQASYQQHEDIAKQIEEMRQKLRASGAGSLLNLLAASDTRVEEGRQLAFDKNSLVETEHTISSLSANREATLEQWDATTGQEIVTAQTSLDQAEASLIKALKHQDLVRLVAPEPAMVLSVAKLSVGSVLKEGDPLMTLAPLRVPVEAEIQIASRDVGFIRVGDPATLKVDAFNSFEHGTAEGKIRSISEGSFTSDDNGNPVPAYYKARISIEKMNFIRVPENFRLIPGMTLTGNIKVGTRSALAYLMGGFVRGAGEAMREP